VFVSEIRQTVSKLLAEGLTLNEIAHRLGVARSTVGYHVRVLNETSVERPAEPDRAVKRRGPVAAPEITRRRVHRLLAGGHDRATVARMLGLTKSTVSYHARRLGEDIDERCARRYDWEAIRRFYDAGHSLAECSREFGFTKASWHDAVRRGLVTPRPARIPLDTLLVAGPRRNRNHVKQRLFDAGLKARRCESCALTEWKGIPIPLALHHINGDRHDNRLENLRLLCGNCHSLTDTYAGRNGRRYGTNPPTDMAA
jgi:DNA-binding CsgD family transcriptional regulator